MTPLSWIGTHVAASNCNPLRKFIILRFIAVQAIVLSISQAQTISAPFATEYTLFDLGSVPGVPIRYGGITFKYDDPDVILIGGNANSSDGAIYAIDVIRNPVTSRITGFDGDATLFSTAPNIDGAGTYDFDGFTSIATLPGGPEGMVFLGDDNPLIGMPSLLVSEYGLSRVSLYNLDVNGVPIVGTRQDFITGLTGAEGAVVDPITGDFFFSTFGSSNPLIRVDGFVPEPGTAGLVAFGLLSLLSRRRR